MVEIMKADNGYIVLDDIDGVRIESDFNKVIDWLREQFNEDEPTLMQSIPVEDGLTGGYYIINNATSDEYVLATPLGLAVAPITEDKQYPVTLDVRPTENKDTLDSGERAILAERK